jgi:hypothetical protein
MCSTASPAGSLRHRVRSPGFRRISHAGDSVWRLTRAPARLNSPAMPRTNPISWLLRALSLAAMGCLLFAGTAAAHAGHASNHGQTALSLSSGPSITSAGNVAASAGENDLHLAAKDPMGQAEDAMQHPGPCSDDQSAGHNGDCCAVACHAALAAHPLGPVLGPERPSLRLFGISRALDGRSGDRTERPPKRI